MGLLVVCLGQESVAMFAGHAILYRELIWFGIVAPVFGVACALLAKEWERLQWVRFFARILLHVRRRHGSYFSKNMEQKATHGQQGTRIRPMRLSDSCE